MSIANFEQGMGRASLMPNKCSPTTRCRGLSLQTFNLSAGPCAGTHPDYILPKPPKRGICGSETSLLVFDGLRRASAQTVQQPGCLQISLYPRNHVGCGTCLLYGALATEG